MTVAQTRLPQQFAGLLQAQVGTAALYRHEAGIERLEQGANGIHVTGQRCHGKGITGKHHQPGLSFLVAGENVLDFETCPHQPRGLQVPVEHGTRQVQHDDACRAGLVKRLRLFLPHRVGQRQGGEQPAEPEQP